MPDAIVTVILGGTSFMGRHLVSQLVQQCRPYVILNRGSSYWGDAPPAGPQHLPMGREEALSVLKAFESLAILLNGRPFSIVDFSCDDAAFMDRVGVAMAATLLTPLAYVLISTDSVYEDRPSAARVATCVGEDARCVPRDRKGYGGDKLRGELALRQYLQQRSATTRCFILRLPDVLGPYDNSGRYWATMLWAMSGVPMLLEEGTAQERLSMVDGMDVANLCYRLATCPSECSAGTYNIACDEAPTLAEFTEMIGLGPVKIYSTLFASSDSSSDSSEYDSITCDYYPSVSCGPLDISAAKKAIGWCPSSLRHTVGRSNEFFQQRPRKGKEYRSAFHKLPWMVRAAVNAK